MSPGKKQKLKLDVDIAVLRRKFSASLEPTEPDGLGSNVDARKIRARQRNVQLSLRVTPAFKASLVAMALDQDMTMTEVIEAAVALFKIDQNKTKGS